MPRVHIAGLPHMMLTRACAEGLTAAELLERAEAHFGPRDVTMTAVTGAAARLRSNGLLRKVGVRRVHGRPCPLYVITAEGEALLDRFHAPLCARRAA